MNAQEIINYIGRAEKKTPVKLYVKQTAPIDWGGAKVFGTGDQIVFGEWKVTEEPTCTRDGSQERVCNNCGFKETETILAPGHKWDTEYTVDQEPTCTEVGYESIHCSVCHIFDESTVREIPKTEHSFGEWEVTQEPNCTKEGSQERVCANCPPLWRF